MCKLIRLSVLAAGLAAAGCTSPRPTGGTFAYLRLPSTSRSVAFAAAEAAVREHFAVDRVDPVHGLITAVPLDTEESQGTGRTSDLVRVPRRMRKAAEARVTGSDTGSEIWCRVTVQRYESADLGMVADSRVRTDSTDVTPIDRDGATTPEQNAFWRTVRRDRDLERAILLAVQERLAKADAPAPPGKKDAG